MYLTETASPCRASSARYEEMRKLLRVMKLTTALILLAFLQVSANGFSQTITLSLKKATLERAFNEIKKQTDYRFVYFKEQLVDAKEVTLNISNGDLEEVLKQCFKDQPLSYSIVNRTIIVKAKQVQEKQADQQPPIEVRGRVTNENGEAVAGATVQVKGSKAATNTDANGEFILTNVNPNDILVISGAEIQPQEIRVSGRIYITARITVKIGELDQVVMMAYGQTTRRLTTGNISKVSAEEISRQPVSNPLAALQGRVPGLVITQTSGVPGSAFKIQIQGQQSIGAKGNTIVVSNDPLYVIDGVPFATGGSVLNQLTSAAGNPDQGFGLSPLNLINPSDIESIEVLKDAAATSIYGSRGANGVVLITTKKGKTGDGKLSVSVYHGESKVTRTTKMLNTKQYLQMRLEGISNDGATINNSSFLTPGYAPDLMFWDTTAYTDWKDYFIGGTAKTTDLQASYSGGTQNTQYIIGVGAHSESTVFPGNLKDSKISTRFNLNHKSTNKKFSLGLSAIYSIDNNHLSGSDLTSSINMIPFLPGLVDASGKLKWEHNGVLYSDLGMQNPLQALNNSYKADNRTLMSNMALTYQLVKGFSIRTTLGYNTISSDESRISPIAFANPATATTGSASFGNRQIDSWVIEPQVEWTTTSGAGKLSILGGGSFQSIENNSETISASGYTSDDLLYSIAAGATLRGSNTYSEYKYNAIFGRLNYNWKNKYLIDLSGRRDGSSRFGTGNQFANFLAVGAAWIFTEETFFKKLKPVFSYGKIKLSYGSTGNDQIGDYKFKSTWTSTPNQYQQIPTLAPSRLANPDFAWEVNRKLQGGLDLGFLNDKVLMSASYYRNRTSNQLVSYPLPIQTGFASLGAKNIPAVIQNTGLEFTLLTKNIAKKSFSWTTSLNVTIGRNKLISYPFLESSSYATTYVIGQSLNVIYNYDFLGTDPATGVYMFRDLNGDGTLNSKDYVVSGSTDPKFYGGMINDITFKGINLNFLFEFRKQVGSDYRKDIISAPGTFVNQPVTVLQRWQKPGDISDFQKFTSYFDSPASLIMTRFSASNQAYSDASFIRLKNVSISYQIPSIRNFPLQGCRIFLQGQNLLTITNYKGSDPENQYLYRLPPLKTFTAGIQLTF